MMIGSLQLCPRRVFRKVTERAGMDPEEVVDPLPQKPRPLPFSWGAVVAVHEYPCSSKSLESSVWCPTY